MPLNQKLILSNMLLSKKILSSMILSNMILSKKVLFNMILSNMIVVTGSYNILTSM